MRYGFKKLQAERSLAKNDAVVLPGDTVGSIRSLQYVQGVNGTRAQKTTQDDSGTVLMIVDNG